MLDSRLPIRANIMNYVEFVANFILEHLRNKFTLFRDGRSISASLCPCYQNYSCKLCNYRLSLDPPRNYFCIGMSFWSHAREVYWINCIVSLLTRKWNGIGQWQHYNSFTKYWLTLEGYGLEELTSGFDSVMRSTWSNLAYLAILVDNRRGWSYECLRWRFGLSC